MNNSALLDLILSHEVSSKRQSVGKYLLTKSTNYDKEFNSMHFLTETLVNCYSLDD